MWIFRGPQASVYTTCLGAGKNVGGTWSPQLLSGTRKQRRGWQNGGCTEKAEVNCSSEAWRKGGEEKSSKGLGKINISY